MVVETFPALETCPFLRHGFLLRVPGIDVDGSREEVLARLLPAHQEERERLGLGVHSLVTCAQVHGANVRRVDRHTVSPVPDADGLVTDDPAICLGIYVADCCAVFLVDPVRRAVGLAHSGRNGTRQGILSEAIRTMQTAFGSHIGDLVVQLSPCIRPPWYEEDFAASIRAQAKGCGAVLDAGTCTAACVDRYYSYRRERGRTGRMLALAGLVATRV